MTVSNQTMPNKLIALKLHHVGHLVKDIKAASRSLTQEYGYEIESKVIEDQVQTAFVQFLRLPKSSSWLELVSPNGENSKLSAALKRGGGLHHLCYEVENIDQACTELRNRKLALLSKPVPAVAFGGRRIAWLIDSTRLLTELVEAGDGPLTLDSINQP